MQLHVWPDVPRRGVQHLAPSRRVLDDRARARLRRPRMLQLVVAARPAVVCCMLRCRLVTSDPVATVGSWRSAAFAAWLGWACVAAQSARWGCPAHGHCCARQEMDMKCAEDYVVHCVRYLLDNCYADLEFMDKQHPGVPHRRAVDAPRRRGVNVGVNRSGGGITHCAQVRSSAAGRRSQRGSTACRTPRRSRCCSSTSATRKWCLRIWR